MDATLAWFARHRRVSLLLILAYVLAVTIVLIRRVLPSPGAPPDFTATWGPSMKTS